MLNLIYSKVTFKARLIVVMSLLVILPLAVTSVISYRQSYEGIKNLVYNDLDYIVHIKSGQLSPYTESTELSENSQVIVDEIVSDVKRNYFEPDGMTGYAYIIDETGKALFHPDEATRGTDLSTYDFIKRMLSQKNGSIEYNWSDGRKIVSFTELPNGWIFAIGSYIDDIMQPASSILDSIAITAVISFILVFIIAYLFGSLTVKPLIEISGAMKELGSGNLAVRLVAKTKDEFGIMKNMYNHMADRLAGVIRSMQATVQNLNASSEDLSASSEENLAATEQVSTTMQLIAESSDLQVMEVRKSEVSVHETTRIVEEMVVKFEDMAKQSETTMEDVNQGSIALSNMAAKMGDIIKSVSIAEEAIDRLGRNSVSIKDIVLTIRGISEQTNLLALNAAIEASRAGGEGRGFAVVANEIRKLADQANQASGEIVRTIESVDTDIQVAVEAVRDTSGAVASGGTAAERMSLVFEKVEKAFMMVDENVSELYKRIEEVKQEALNVEQGSDSIAGLSQKNADAINEISVTYEQLNASMEDITGTAQGLAAMAEQLQQIVNEFRFE
ncbi:MULTISPECIES: methyl-accepting chemotaxis protein [Paenibacillus]|uniref:methyl-accepting chemotaxis protein n=1 Tax=Paenibacillus TaxID=44249 RepID=UPI00049064F9|nr:methyl-accepting chemotaxis protein [Paenibacillus sp. J14]